jgi:hypothetical protein
METLSSIHPLTNSMLTGGRTVANIAMIAAAAAAAAATLKRRKFQW